jgi:hypothetical protein
MAQSGFRVPGSWVLSGMEFPSVIREFAPASEELYGTILGQPGVRFRGEEAESRAFIDACSRRFRDAPAPLFEERVIRQIQGGRQVVVSPKDRATASSG